MKKPTKILIGLATLWPLIYMIFFFVLIVSFMLFIAMDKPEPGSGPPLFFFIIFPLHFITMIWMMALSVFYIVNVFRNERVEKDKKALWAVVLFLGNVISMPIY